MCDRSVQQHIVSLVPDSKIDNMLDKDIDNHLSLILSYINSNSVFLTWICVFFFRVTYKNGKETIISVKIMCIAYM